MRTREPQGTRFVATDRVVRRVRRNPGHALPCDEASYADASTRAPPPRYAVVAGAVAPPDAGCALGADGIEMGMAPRAPDAGMAAVTMAADATSARRCSRAGLPVGMSARRGHPVQDGRIPTGPVGGARWHPNRMGGSCKAFAPHGATFLRSGVTRCEQEKPAAAPTPPACSYESRSMRSSSRSIAASSFVRLRQTMKARMAPHTTVT